MRKLLSLSIALALAYSIPIPVRAGLLKKVKLDGSFETRSFGIDNETDRNGAADDYRSETNTRLMVGTNFDLLDDVHARLLVARSPRMGTIGSPATMATVEQTLGFHNGYVKIDKVFGAVDLTIGRQFGGPSPNDLTIYFGPQNDDFLTVTSFDGFLADAVIAHGLARFVGIAGKLNEAATGTVGTNSDITFYGGELGSEKVLPYGYLAGYYYFGQMHAVKSALSTGNDTLAVAGLRAQGGIIKGLGYHVEIIQDFGRNNNGVGHFNLNGTLDTVNNPETPANPRRPAYTGSAYFIGFNYANQLNALPVRGRLEYGRGSRNFIAIAPGRRFGLIWGEHSNVGPSSLNGVNGAGLSNLKVLDTGVGVNPIAKLGVDVNAYRFRYDDGAVAGGKTSAGAEYDFIVSWKHSDNVSFEVNAATFQVGDALQNAGAPTNPITRLGADVKIKF